jgi:hypothetical protein
MQQQQQQSASYDLLAIFPDETKADSATAKLHKEGFGGEEVFQLSGSIGSGQYREHGPNQTRREVFLQTQRTGLSPVAIALLVIILGLLGAGLTFVATFALPPIHTMPAFLIGAAIGIILGILIGLFQRTRVRGNIGQRPQNQATAPPGQNTRTVVALRFVDSDNVSRRSRARAILLNNQGKIDRSVGRWE